MSRVRTSQMREVYIELSPANTIPMNKLHAGQYGLTEEGRVVLAVSSFEGVKFILIDEENNWYYSDSTIPVSPIPSGSKITITV